MSELLSSMGLLEAEIEAFEDLHLISQHLGLERAPPPPAWSLVPTGRWGGLCGGWVCPARAYLEVGLSS